MDSEPLILKSDTKELEHVANKIKKDLPMSAYVYNSLLMHSKKFTNCYDYYTLKAHPESHLVLWKNKENQMACGIHCPENEVPLLEKVLRKTKIIDFSKTICVFHVPEYLLSLVQNIAKEKVGQEMTLSHSYEFTFDLAKSSSPLRCPAGFKVCQLGKAGVNKMHGNWMYKTAVPLEAIEELAEKMGVAVGIYEDLGQKQDYIVQPIDIPLADNDKVPVAWMGAYQCGPLGMQMTEEGFRRRGFATLLAQICARRMASKGFFPFTSTEEDLIPLKMMFEKLPEWTMTNKLTWCWQFK